MPDPDLRVTLLVPTMNRSAFVMRLLAYYAHMGFTGRIAIGDSSNVDHVTRNREAIEPLQAKLDIAYVESPRTPLGACVQQLLDHITTPYAAILPDDDFLVPASLERCARFLSEHPDYAAAHGHGVGVNLASDGLHGNITQCAYYPQPVIEAETAAQRLDDHLNNYRVSMFSVHRLDTWRAMLRQVHLQEDVPFSSELLPCCHSVIAGKVKQLDCLYVFRQNHNLRYEVSSALDWLTTPQWLPSFQVFLADLSEALAVRDGIAIEAAQKIVKGAFTQYLVREFGVRRRWSGAPWTLAAARRAKRFLNTLKPKEHSKFELTALLDPASPYHVDFIPVYQALLGTGVEQAAPVMTAGGTSA